MPPDEAFYFVMGWFSRRVFYHGEWDYKWRGTDSQSQREYRDFGNYNFAYVGSVLGFPRGLLYGAAGLIQMGNLSWRLGYGIPFVSGDQGDSPDDHDIAERGVDDFERGKMSTCRPQP
jgi:hypothetical protein